MRYDYLYMDPWSADKKEKYQQRPPLYICLSGNSGVGKSTLLKRLSAYLFKNDPHTIAVDEKVSTILSCLICLMIQITMAILFNSTL